MQLGKFKIIVAACSAADGTSGSFISHAKSGIRKKSAYIKSAFYMLL